MKNVIVVGAGLSGLIAARSLHRAGCGVIVLEAKDAVGGRIQTDKVDGFLLDHGFQVFLTAYETARKELDVEQLQLGRFPAGALVQYQGRRYRVCDPIRSAWWLAPKHAWETLRASLRTGLACPQRLAGRHSGPGPSARPMGAAGTEGSLAET